MSTFTFEGIKLDVENNSTYLQGEIKPLTSIIGKSEKHLLLKILSARSNIASVGWINGMDISSKKATEALKHSTSYIERNQSHLQSMTIEEHLKASIDLHRKGRNKNAQTKELEEILKILDLYSVKDSKCEELSEFHLKVLSIALELTKGTGIVFLETPLDEFYGIERLNLLTILRNIVTERKINIIITIKDPSKRILIEFDHIIILKDGKITFQGPFKQIEGDFETKTPFEDVLLFDFDSNFVKNENIITTLEHPYHPSFAKQIAFLFKRLWKIFKRNWRLEVFKILISIFLGLMIGLVNVNTSSDDDTGEQSENFSGALFFYSTSPFVMGLIGSIGLFHRNKKESFREMKDDLYGTVSFLTTKTLFELITCSYSPFIQVLVGYYIVGLDPDFSSFLMIGLFASLSCICGNIIGTFISSISANIAIAFSIAPFILMPFMLVSGIFIATISSFLDWVKYISPIYYSYSGMFQVQFSSDNTSCDPNLLDCSNEQANIINEFYPTFSQGVDVVFMVAIYLLVWIFCLVALNIRIMILKGN